jgi:hypothetical protein
VASPANALYIPPDHTRLLLFPPEMEGSCAPQGCKTLSELGSGTDCERKRWWLRAANLRADELSALACSSSGSEVLEKIITSARASRQKCAAHLGACTHLRYGSACLAGDLDAAKRHAIFDGLVPSCVAIAATPPGSYLLERASRAVGAHIPSASREVDFANQCLDSLSVAKMSKALKTLPLRWRVSSRV